MVLPFSFTVGVKTASLPIQVTVPVTPLTVMVVALWSIASLNVTLTFDFVDSDWPVGDLAVMVGAVVSTVKVVFTVRWFPALSVALRKTVYVPSAIVLVTFVPVIEVQVVPFVLISMLVMPEPASLVVQPIVTLVLFRCAPLAGDTNANDGATVSTTKETDVLFTCPARSVALTLST